jgi:hypothetical protein
MLRSSHPSKARADQLQHGMPGVPVGPPRKPAHPKLAVPTLGPLDGGLQTNSRQRQNPLKNSRQADQRHEQFEKIGQPAISNKLVDGPKADRANHDDD